MKIVKEYLNEKFTEDGDPIADMNIGGISLGIQKTIFQTKIKKQWKDYITNLLQDKTISGYFRHDATHIPGKVGSPERGKDWGNYTFKVGIIGEIQTPFENNYYSELGVKILDAEHKNVYFIPYSDKKIHIL